MKLKFFWIQMEYSFLIHLSQILILVLLNFNYHNINVCNGTTIDKDSDYEEEALEEFRELVKDSSLAYRDFMKSDGYLIRWLRANDFDVEVALEKFRKSMEWRKTNNIDLIFLEDFSVIDETYHFTADGFDKAGRPIVWVPFGSYDVRKVAVSGAQDKYQRYLIRLYEFGELLMFKLRQAGSENITQLIGIYDLAGFNLKLGGCINCLGMIPELVSNYDSNYPDIFYKAFVINTPKLFHTALNIGENFMNQRTRDSLLTFDYDKSKWEAALHQQISIDQLPVEYGGNKLSFFSNVVRNRHKQFISNMTKLGVQQIERELQEKSGHLQQIALEDEQEEKGMIHLIDDFSIDNKRRLNNPNSQKMNPYPSGENIVGIIEEPFEKPRLLKNSTMPYDDRHKTDNKSNISDYDLNRHHRHHHHYKNNISQTTNQSIIMISSPVQNEEILLSSSKKQFHRKHKHQFIPKPISSLSNIKTTNLIIFNLSIFLRSLF